MSGEWSYAHHADETPPDVYLSTRDACAAADVTYKQADHWLRTGVIELEGAATPGSGYRRRWSGEDVTVLRVLGRISAALNNQPDRRVLAAAAEETRRLIANGWLGDPVYITLPYGVQITVETTP